MKKQTVFIIRLVSGIFKNQPYYIKLNQNITQASDIILSSDIGTVDKPHLATEFKTWDHAEEITNRMEEVKIHPNGYVYEVHTRDAAVYEVQVTGSGTRRDIVKALIVLSESIEHMSDEDYKLTTLEDPTLCTQLLPIDAEENNITE